MRWRGVVSSRFGLAEGGAEMRRIVLDTETTGLNCRTGDRVIEIGCVELLGRNLTGRRFHKYINPERDIPEEAMKIHGITNERVADEPVFARIVDEFLEFVAGAQLVIHNAKFDCEFLDSELSRCGRDNLEHFCGKPIDTLADARLLRPGKKNNLNALCSEFGINNSGRTLHGALLDAELLAEVYLAMTRGQNSLEMFSTPPVNQARAAGVERPPLAVLRASPDELAEHERVLGEVDKESKGKCLWRTAQAAV
jgi:DNA polymerase-3 subunit epsilon